MESIQLQNLGKRYRLGEDSAGDFRDRVTRGLSKGEREEFWALRSIDLSVEEGATLGIVGSNGAGKSTLLKLISKVVEPTEGVARTRGRVSALLEAGVGFHPELTGRENIMLGGAIHGMSRQAVRQRLDEIVEFAGIDRFVDTPVKRYSSGMLVRLGFSIAAHLDTQIMVVDEVLSVGDANFRSKAVRRVEDLVKSGTTVLFVSHDLGSLERLCSNSIWLEAGQLRAEGPTREVLDQYLASARVADVSLLAPAPGAPARITSLRLLDEHDNPTSVVSQGQPWAVEVGLDITEARADTYLVVLLSTATQTLLTSSRFPTPGLPPLAVGENRVIARFPGDLCPGQFTIGINLRDDLGSHLLHDYQVRALEMRVDGANPGVPNQLITTDVKWGVDR